MDKIFKAAYGSSLSDDEAQRYGERITELEIKNRDCDDFPGLIIEDASSESSPLNEYFEWNDSIAGYKYRRHQAQMLLCTIQVEIINPNTETTEITRAFHPVTLRQQDKDQTIEVRTWTTKERILSDVELRKQIIDKALAELDSWRKKYDQYTELSTIFDAIKQMHFMVVTK